LTALEACEDTFVWDRHPLPRWRGDSDPDHFIGLIFPGATTSPTNDGLILFVDGGCLLIGMDIFHLMYPRFFSLKFNPKITSTA
jgi:hypothetical protein